MGRIYKKKTNKIHKQHTTYIYTSHVQHLPIIHRKYQYKDNIHIHISRTTPSNHTSQIPIQRQHTYTHLTYNTFQSYIANTNTKTTYIYTSHVQHLPIIHRKYQYKDNIHIHISRTTPSN